MSEAREAGEFAPTEQPPRRTANRFTRIPYENPAPTPRGGGNTPAAPHLIRRGPARPRETEPTKTR